MGGQRYTTHCNKGHELAAVGKGERGRCMECVREWNRKKFGFSPRRPWSRERKNAYQQRYRLFTRFGVTLDEYNELLARQSGVCAVCGKVETATLRGKPMHLAVDHDHATGKIRGLLCKACNGGLGIFEDDESRIEAALAYLRKART